MDFLYVLVETLMCFFCVLGLYFAVTKISDGVAMKNAPSKCLIVIDECKKADFEYLVRYLESRIIDGDFEKMMCGIGVSASLGIEADIFSKLSSEYGNIYLI